MSESLLGLAVFISIYWLLWRMERLEDDREERRVARQVHPRNDRIRQAFMPMTHCEHANEWARGVCRCPKNCGCRESMCPDPDTGGY